MYNHTAITHEKKNNEGKERKKVNEKQTKNKIKKTTKRTIYNICILMFSFIYLNENKY